MFGQNGKTSEVTFMASEVMSNQPDALEIMIAQRTLRHPCPSVISRIQGAVKKVAREENLPPTAPVTIKVMSNTLEAWTDDKLVGSFSEEVPDCVRKPISSRDRGKVGAAWGQPR